MAAASGHEHTTGFLKIFIFLFMYKKQYILVAGGKKSQTIGSRKSKT